MPFNLFRWLHGAVDAVQWAAEASEDFANLLKNPILTVPRNQAKKLAKAARERLAAAGESLRQKETA